MSTRTVTKKRKSADGMDAMVKKAKITKSANKSAPLKSALKKPKAEAVEAVVTNPKPSASKKKTPKAAKNMTGIDDVTVASIGKAAAENTEDGHEELTEDQTAALLAGFSSSEDEAEDNDEDGGIPISNLPSVPNTGASQKITKQTGADGQKDDPETSPGVVYIGRIPHGFYERQMHAYFSQFGDINHLRLARNRKTGKSQHYAFVEFASAAVADVVVRTMDKYLLVGHLLQVRHVPLEQINEGIWKGTGRRKKPAPRNRLEGNLLKRGMLREKWEKRVEKENKRRQDKEEKLKEMGYEFEMPVVKSVSDVPVAKKDVEGAAGDGEVDGGSQPARDEVVEVTSKTQAEPGVVEVDEVKAGKQKRAADGKPGTTKKVVKKVKT